MPAKAGIQSFNEFSNYCSPFSQGDVAKKGKSFQVLSQNQFSRNTLHSRLALVTTGHESRKVAKKGVKQDSVLLSFAPWRLCERSPLSFGF
jgi:hypothetical protein